MIAAALAAAVWAWPLFAADEAAPPVNQDEASADNDVKPARKTAVGKRARKEAEAKRSAKQEARQATVDLVQAIREREREVIKLSPELRLEVAEIDKQAKLLTEKRQAVLIEADPGLADLYAQLAEARTEARATPAPKARQQQRRRAGDPKKPPRLNEDDD